jgi:hypothetical protein
MKNQFKELQLTNKQTKALLNAIDKRLDSISERLDEKTYANEHNLLLIIQDDLSKAPVYQVTVTRNSITKRRIK